MPRLYAEDRVKFVFPLLTALAVASALRQLAVGSLLAREGMKP
jgi:hypothetical protein